MNNKSKYSLSLVIGTVFLVMIFANCFTAWAENPSQVTIKVSPENAIKPTVRQSGKNSNTEYNVKVESIKIIKHGEAVSSDSKFKTEIKIFPIEEMSSKASESEKTSGEKNGRRQRSHPEKSGYSGKVRDKSVSISKGDKKHEIKIGPNNALATEKLEKIQSPISERIKVTRVRAWKLDESGNKTNDKILDDKSVIEGINQP